ncbi:MAG: hypothetical protein ACI9G1_004120 [Pirellulaceae bacterium]
MWEKATLARLDIAQRLFLTSVAIVTTDHNTLSNHNDSPVALASLPKTDALSVVAVSSTLAPPTSDEIKASSGELKWQAVGIAYSFLIHGGMILTMSYALYSATKSPAERMVVNVGIAIPDESLEEELLIVDLSSMISAPPTEANDVSTLATIPAAPETIELLPGVAVSAGPNSNRSLLPRVGIDLLMQSDDRPRGGGFEGRKQQAKARLLSKFGGTDESETAVALGLAWLARHQNPDGSWRFNLREGPCLGKCSQSGTAETTTGATGLALLPFLGAGETTASETYGENVRRGLQYLIAARQQSPNGYDLQEGTMYAQGIATVALCEAYAMTGDSQYREPAQQALNFIVYAQHADGGWRYFPNQAGDTTVFGWQLMALKSGKMAGLDIPAHAFAKARDYLDKVQTENGAYYGYRTPGAEATPTAVGLLSRMYLGWRQSHSALRHGSEHIYRLGSSRTDMYFNYYATQVLHHYEAPSWNSWNEQLRDRLVATQSKFGHERGSWYFHDKHSLSGGRLYNTALCTMILEVYYRHMPLYRRDILD